jgi:hypothetical protein
MTSTERSFQPNDSAHAIYDRLFREVYVPLFPSVQGAIDRLTRLTYEEQH